MQVLATQAHLLQQVDDLLGELAARRLPLHLERAPDDVPDQVSRVQRRERVLEHDLAVAAIPLPGVALEEVDPVPVLDRGQVGRLGR